LHHYKQVAKQLSRNNVLASQLQTSCLLILLSWRHSAIYGTSTSTILDLWA